MRKVLIKYNQLGFNGKWYNLLNLRLFLKYHKDYFTKKLLLFKL